MSSSKKKRNKFLHGLKVFFCVAGIILLATIAIGSGVVIGALAGYIESTELVNMQQLLDVNLTSFIYTIDADGNEKQLEVLYDDENRVWADMDEIPENLINAFIAIEDERFYTHNGFDIKRTFGAAIEYIEKKITGSSGSTYGGSTITQQLIKNVTGEDDYSINRKIQEIYRAYKLEQELDKDQILELYLNTIYLSQQCNGVKSAAKVYFNKNLNELTLEECATIAAITQFPTKYDPKRNPENNKERRNVILNQMYKLGYISESECEEAKATDVVTVDSSQTDAYISTTTYYSDAVIDQVINDLVKEKGYTEAIAERLLYCGGLKIYAAMDTEIQAIMDEYYADDSHFPSLSNNPNIIQSSMAIIDPKTGYVAGLVGGRGLKEASRTLNRATQTLRQPGSSIKPLAIYAPAVEYGIVTPSSIVSDSPITINGWSPRNDDRAFRGNIRVSSALAGSRNVPAVRILQKVGLERSFRFLTNNFRLSSLVESRESNGKTFTDKGYASIGLGGLTDGVSVLEMTAGYVPFASGGYYYEPAFYTKILDSNGAVLLERKPNPQPAISESTAVTMTQMLTGVVTSGTGTSARLSGMPSAGKTGTTSNNYDRWFVGYTPYYVGAVWHGFDQPASLRGVSGNPSAKVWKGIMQKIHESLPYKDFSTLGETSHYLVCTESGLLPNSTCTDVVFGDYEKTLAPTRRCNVHEETDNGSGQLIVATFDPNQPPTGTEIPGTTTGDGLVSPDGAVTPDVPVVSPEVPVVTPEVPVSPEVSVNDSYSLIVDEVVDLVQ